MSANVNEEGNLHGEPGAQSEAAEEVRKAFSSLPLGARVETLVNVQLDMLGDVVNKIASETSKVFDDLADSISGAKPGQEEEAKSDEPASQS